MSASASPPIASTTSDKEMAAKLREMAKGPLEEWARVLQYATEQDFQMNANLGPVPPFNRIGVQAITVAKVFE